MKIKTLHGVNIKGREFHHNNLSGVNLFTGPNYAGKSARLEAVQLALLGYLPNGGKGNKARKENKAIFELSSGSQMTVSAEFDNGRTVGREWTAKGKSVTYKGFDGEVVPLVMMDANAFLGMSDTVRARYVFGMCPTELTVSMLESAVRGMQVSGNPEHVNKAIESVVALILKDREETDFQSRALSIIDEIKNNQSTANAEAKRYKETIQGIAQLKIESTGNEINAEALAEQVNTARQELSTANVRLGAIRAAIKNRVDVNRQIADIEEKISEIENNRLPKELREENPEARIKVLEDDRAKLVLQRDTATAQILELEALQRNIDNAESQSLKPEEIEELAQIRRRKKLAKRNPSVDLDYDNEMLSEANSIRESHQSLIDSRTHAIDKMKSDHARNLQFEECPVCGSSHEWKKAAEKKLKKSIAELEKLQVETKGKLAEDLAEIERLKSHIESVKNHIVEWNKDDVRLAALSSRENSGNAERVKAWKDRIHELGSPAGVKREASESIATIDADLENLRAAMKAQEKESALPGLRAELERFSGLKTSEDLDESLASTTAEIEEINERLNSFRQQEQVIQNRKADDMRMAESESKYEASTIEAAVCKEAVSLLDSLIETETQKALKPLLDRAAAFSNGVLRSPLEFHNGEIGRWEGKNWVNTSCMSGTEQAVTFAAIQCALTADSESKVILIDELGTIQIENKIALIKNIIKAVKDGIVDQFFGADIYKDSYAGIDGLNIVEIK